MTTETGASPREAAGGTGSLRLGAPRLQRRERSPFGEREVNKLKGATPAPCPEHHLHQLAAAGDEVDGELLLPAHHARSLYAASIATTASASAAQPGAAAPAPLALLP